MYMQMCSLFYSPHSTCIYTCTCTCTLLYNATLHAAHVFIYMYMYMYVHVHVCTCVQLLVSLKRCAVLLFKCFVACDLDRVVVPS